jgi:hypothetical protein
MPCAVAATGVLPLFVPSTEAEATASLCAAKVVVQVDPSVQVCPSTVVAGFASFAFAIDPASIVLDTVPVSPEPTRVPVLVGSRYAPGS